MKKLLLLAVCAWSIVALPHYAEASCVVETSVTSSAEGAPIRDDRCDTNKNKNITMGTLMSGEDQTNNLLMTSGGVVRSTVITTAVTTDTTSAAVQLPVGNKSIQATITAGTQTHTIYGGKTSGVTTATGIQLCQIVLTASKLTDACPPITANYLFYIDATTATTGGASGDALAMY